MGRNGGKAKRSRAVLGKAIQLKKERFLESYGNLGNITAASQSAGVTRNAHYLWLEEDEAYAKAFAEKTKEAAERLEEEARRRAFAGVDKPLVYQGKITKDEAGNPVTIKEYSDTLLIFLMKGAMAHKYGDRLVHSGEGRGAIEHNVRFYIPHNRRDPQPALTDGNTIDAETEENER